MLVFGKKASWMFFFQTILTNPIISQIQFLWRNHFSTLLELSVETVYSVAKSYKSTEKNNCT